MRARLLLVLVCVALWPGVAHATAWWGFLQELSGPGPFQGVGVALRTFCIRDDGSVTTCLHDRNPDAIRQILNLQVGIEWSGEGERFQSAVGNAGRVFVTRVEPVYQFRVHPALDLGAGAGLIRFSGDGFASMNRLSLIPASVTFTPGMLSSMPERWSRVIRLRFDELLLPKGFDGDDFGSPPGVFHTDREWLSSVSVVFDVLALF